MISPKKEDIDRLEKLVDDASAPKEPHGEDVGSRIEIALDDMVHDLKSKEGSNINNCGIRDQIEYILEGYTPGEGGVTEFEEDLKEIIEEARKEEDELANDS